MNFSYFRDFEDGATIGALGYEIVIRRRSVGQLSLPSGSLIACDPLMSLETEPFSVHLSPGTYTVSLIMAELRDETRVAYAMLRLGPGEPLRWETAVVAPVDHKINVLDAIDDVGYSVDSSIGCFMDAETATALLDYQQIVMPEDNDLERLIGSRIRKRRRGGCGSAIVDLKRDLKMPNEDGRNLIAFETGYGRGVYTTYVGFDEEDEIVSVVTDFEVLDLRFPSFRLRSSKAL
ncbi:MAG: DUF4241 domain-containing protein [Bradymonadaceae bacterium]